MSKSIQSVKGMNDILPEDICYWQFLEKQLRNLSQSYGYSEIRTPILEKTNLFQRSIGEVTDIVSKEMYTFDDRDGTSLSLRPEGTAGVIRAGIQHGLLYNQTQRLWYLEPIFRHERPQRGRYRQFYQFGLEAIGFAGPEVEVEQILFNAKLWKLLSISDKVKLQINTLGSSECRNNYREELVHYFKENYAALDDDSKTRLEKNPLRILDSKNPAMQELINNAPTMQAYLSESSLQHFNQLQSMLTTLGIEFEINPTLVRGLDYYSHTVFEWVTDCLGAQGTVSAGGRYDVLVEQLGGKPTHAFGFAMGIERIIELIKETQSLQVNDSLDIFIMAVGDNTKTSALKLAEMLRGAKTSLRIWVELHGGSFKSQIKKADKSNAKIAFILGEDEVKDNNVTIKYLREDKPQVTISQQQILDHLEV